MIRLTPNNGSFGTFCSGLGWSMSGWNGVCLAGGLFASAPLVLSAYEKLISTNVVN